MPSPVLEHAANDRSLAYAKPKAAFADPVSAGTADLGAGCGHHRRVVAAPGDNRCGSYRIGLTLEGLDSAAAVAALEREVAGLLGGAAPIVHRTPQPKLSPAG